MRNGMSRPSKLFGRNGRLGVGRTTFFENYVYDRETGGEQFIPGTRVPRLKLANIGKRAIAAFDDEVDALIEALRAERDGDTTKRKSARNQAAAHKEENVS
jgi:hypothetical protein